VQRFDVAPRRGRACRAMRAWTDLTMAARSRSNSAPGVVEGCFFTPAAAPRAVGLQRQGAWQCTRRLRQERAPPVGIYRPARDHQRQRQRRLRWKRLERAAAGATGSSRLSGPTARGAPASTRGWARAAQTARGRPGPVRRRPSATPGLTAAVPSPATCPPTWSSSLGQCLPHPLVIRCGGTR
jgi:hypothetical protein